MTDFCDYPEAALNKSKIGGFINPSIEKIVSLTRMNFYNYIYGCNSSEKDLTYQWYEEDVLRLLEDRDKQKKYKDEKRRYYHEREKS